MGAGLGTYEWDWDGAERAYRRALELNPNYATAHHWYGWYLVSLGRYEEAVAELKHAQELDPLSLIITTNVARMYYFARRYKQAEDIAREALRMDPNFAEAHATLGRVYLVTGRPQEAVAAFRRAQQLLPSRREYEAGMAEAYLLMGKREEARRILQQMKNESRTTYVPANCIAHIYVSLGEKGLAFRWLERSLELHERDAAQIRVEPRFDVLRDDPRYQALLRRMNLEP